MKNKVIVIGSPGAGKSTFSRKLHDLTGLPLYHLDMINHKPDRTTVTREEFDRCLDEILSCERWLIDGNYQRTIEKRIQACETVFLLDYPLETCLSGAEERVGKKREDMPWIENELDPEFRQFIIDFQTAKLPEIYTLLKKYSEGREIIIFHSRQESEEWLKKEEEKCQK